VTSPARRPPAFAVRLLAWRFPAIDAEAIVGDLTEEFAARVARDGHGAARRWFWRQALQSMTARRRDAVSAARRSRPLAGVSQDLRFGLRSLRRSPGFAGAAVGTLALAIGAATAVGTAASHTLLRPLPFPAADRLVAMGHDTKGELSNVGFETVVDWRTRLTSLDELAIIRSWQPTLTGDDGAVRVDGIRVTWNYFRMLGVHPALGRDFTEADDTPDSWHVVMLSDRLWRQRFGGSPAIVGTTIDFNGSTFTVAGVLPPTFEPLISGHFYRPAEIWAPLGYAVGGDSSCRSCRHLRALGRLKTGVTTAEARAELAAVQTVISREHPGAYTSEPPRLDSLHDTIAGAMTRPIEVLAAAVAFVLLVACANIAGLLMARAADRTAEMALRSALGASRGRLVRQLLVETAAIAALAAVGGLFIARAALSLSVSAIPVAIPRLDGAAADPWLFGIAAAISVLALAASALIPALMSSQVGLEASLREAKQTATRGSLRVREWLMGIELAAALLVVTVGGLMSRTVDHLLHVDPGFRTEGVLTAGLSLIGPRWAEDRDVRAFQTELLQRVRALPGISSAALAGQIPLGGNYDTRGYYVIGRPIPPDAERPSVERYSVTPDYFGLMGIPLQQGRLLTAADRFAADPVIVIGETMAREQFPDQSPIGQQVRFGSDRNPHVMTIVGVVGDVRHYSLATPPTQQFYSTQEQMTDSYLVLLVKTDHAAAAAVSIRQALAAFAPDVPLYSVRPLDTLVSDSIATRTFLMLLLNGLGGLTLVLAGVGLYGVVSQSVAARRRELGIRVALGASRSSVMALVARRGATVFLTGSIAGLAAAVGAGTLIQSQLYETRPLDPVTIAGAIGLLAVVAVAAHFAPLRRALRTDPRETLRAD
jgi:putative ABC transport system permease protein